jgi:hypothetical protein
MQSPQGKLSPQPQLTEDKTPKEIQASPKNLSTDDMLGAISGTEMEITSAPINTLRRVKDIFPPKEANKEHKSPSPNKKPIKNKGNTLDTYEFDWSTTIDNFIPTPASELSPPQSSDPRGNLLWRLQEQSAIPHAGTSAMC